MRIIRLESGSFLLTVWSFWNLQSITLCIVQWGSK